MIRKYQGTLLSNIPLQILAAEALKSAVGVGSQKAAEATEDMRGKAGAAAEDIKGKATDASYEAEKMKAEGGKQINQGMFRDVRESDLVADRLHQAATEAKKAAQ